MMLGGEQLLCKSLLDRGAARLICFEPDEVECRKLNDALGGSRGLALPHFVGDGRDRTYYQTNYTMTGSLYAPNSRFVDLFHHLGDGLCAFKKNMRCVRSAWMT